jgi:hypothetical protein
MMDMGGTAGAILAEAVRGCGKWPRLAGPPDGQGRPMPGQTCAGEQQKSRAMFYARKTMPSNQLCEAKIWRAEGN